MSTINISSGASDASGADLDITPFDFVKQYNDKYDTTHSTVNQVCKDGMAIPFLAGLLGLLRVTPRKTFKTFNQVVGGLAAKLGPKSPELLAEVLKLGHAQITKNRSVKYVQSLTSADKQRYKDAVNDAVNDAVI